MAKLGVSFTTAEFPDPMTLLDLACELEEKGVDEIFLTESINDVLTLATAVLMRTKRAIVGTAIANIYFRHPYSAGLAAALNDQVSGGRFVLGLGVGHHMTVVKRLGMDLDRPLHRMRNYLTAVRATLDTNPISVTNDLYQITGAGLRWRPEKRVPVVLAALSPGMVKLAATTGDGIIMSLATLDAVRLFRRQMNEAAEAIGKDPASLKIYATIRCCVRDNREEAREMGKRGIGYTALPYYQRAFERFGLPPSSTGIVDDAQLDAVAIAGTPEDFRERLDALRDAGVDVPLISPVSVEPSRVDAYRQLTSLAL